MFNSSLKSHQINFPQVLPGWTFVNDTQASIGHYFHDVLFILLQTKHSVLKQGSTSYVATDKATTYRTCYRMLFKTPATDQPTCYDIVAIVYFPPEMAEIEGGEHDEPRNISWLVSQIHQARELQRLLVQRQMLFNQAHVKKDNGSKTDGPGGGGITPMKSR